MTAGSLANWCGPQRKVVDKDGGGGKDSKVESS